MTRLAWLSSLILLAFAPAAARAADAYVTATVNLRAGPDIGYPRVDIIPVGYAINIYGCTTGWTWCDVGYRGDRGWIAGSFIEFYDNGYYRPLPQYGVQVGIPIVTFSINLYWSNYYTHRAFYRERNYWYARPIPHRPAPPPPRRPWHRPPIGEPRPAAVPGPQARPMPSPSVQPMPANRPAPKKGEGHGKQNERKRGDQNGH